MDKVMGCVPLCFAGVFPCPLHSLSVGLTTRATSKAHLFRAMYSALRCKHDGTSLSWCVSYGGNWHVACKLKQSWCAETDTQLRPQREQTDTQFSP